jgi:hypothetical protein
MNAEAVAIAEAEAVAIAEVDEMVSMRLSNRRSVSLG